MQMMVEQWTTILLHTVLPLGKVVVVLSSILIVYAWFYRSVSLLHRVEEAADSILYLLAKKMGHQTK